MFNTYSNPSKRFMALLSKASAQAKGAELLVCGDFNAADQSWGCIKGNAKGKHLAKDVANNGYVLATDLSNPTRTGNSKHRDTTPDLTFIKNIAEEKVTWRNTVTDLFGGTAGRSTNQLDSQRERVVSLGSQPRHLPVGLR